MAEPGFAGRILIIDDADANRYIFRRVLNQAGFAVDEASTGREGLAKSLSLPDVIVSDVNLPDIFGYDVCRRLKSNPLTRSIPVLQISASFVSDESRVQALNGGADSFLTMPFEPAVLVAQIHALLRLGKAEALAQMSALRWQTTFDALSDGLALTDVHGRILHTNGALARMLEMTTTELEAAPIDAVMESRFGVEYPEFLRRTSAGQSAEFCFDRRWFLVRFDQVQPDPDVRDGSILIVTDITDHKKLQESLKLSERMAATGRLAHIIAHEINNPLEAMSNLLYLAEQDTKGMPQISEYIQLASLELMRISNITKKVLAYHRESTEPVQTRASEIVEGVLVMFQSQAVARGIRLTSRLGCTDFIHVHPGEIRQVFSNLVANALDAIGTGGGTLHVRCLRSVDLSTQRAGVRILFSDSGIGISDEVLPRIYEAFYTTKDLKGSGIGLWLSAEVIGKHAGIMRVRTRTSGPYRGSLFDVFLPFS